ncbi:vacuolar protein sorting-associated protein 75 [Trichomonascus vanleenenianus]|uniref:Vps75p n=1 Tax=Trichomonascus vanleenenianus TaxID=2268995 RepID=UPI003ECA9AC6
MSDAKKVENGKEEAGIELPEGVDQAVFDELAEIMESQSAAEEEIDAFAHKKLAPVHDKRREVTKKIPSFWPVVIEASGVLTEYMTLDDQQVIEKLKDITVEWDDKEPKDFTITMEFDENDYLDTLKMSKKFTYVKEDGNEKYTSEPVELKWKKGKNLLLNKDDESFFNWFSYTGSGSGDYSSGHEVAALIADDIFPHAIKFFVDRSAFSDDEDVELEYDLEEDEEEDNADHEDAPPKKKLKADE